MSPNSAPLLARDPDPAPAAAPLSVVPPAAPSPSNPVPTATQTDFTGLDEKLSAELPTFELFFKTFGFKRVHGRVWGLLVLAGQPLSSREISSALSLSQGATSTAVNELSEWGAIRSDFDAHRRCHLHAPVGNTLSIVATVFRRREQVAIGRLRVSAQATLGYVRERYGDRDPRVLTLRSILTSLDLADAVMQLVFTSVERALGDSQSLLSRAVGAALKVGLKAPRGKGPKKSNASAPLSAKEMLARLPPDEDSGEDVSDELDENPLDAAPEPAPLEKRHA